MAEHTVCSCSGAHLWRVQHLPVGASTYDHEHLHGHPHHGIFRNDSRYMDFRSTSTSPSCYTRNHQQRGLAQPDCQLAGRTGLRYRVAWL
jgi:hypothetical protein